MIFLVAVKGYLEALYTEPDKVFHHFRIDQIPVGGKGDEQLLFKTLGS